MNIAVSLLTVFIYTTTQVKVSASKMALPKTMKAVGLYNHLPISDPDSLLDLVLPVPTIKSDEYLIEVKAIAVNPIDKKIRALKTNVETEARVLGWDGSGIVAAKGDAVKNFKVGDEVFFTGDIRKNGSNAQYVALGEIFVAPKPKSLTFEEAAAMPFSTVTAYECLYDRLGLSEKDEGKTLLIINSGGGVGSVASQLAKNLKLKVIGTASRTETYDFSLRHGADIVLNHTIDLAPQLEANGYSKGVDYILVNYDPFVYWDTLMKIIMPQGKICLLVDSTGLVDLRPLKEKSVTLVSEMVATRIKYDTDDKERHHDILVEISKMLDSGKLKTTLAKTVSPINAANLKEAHKTLEGKRMVGKLVLTGF